MIRTTGCVPGSSIRVMPTTGFTGSTYLSVAGIFADAKLPRTVKTIVLPSYSSEASSAT